MVSALPRIAVHVNGRELVGWTDLTYASNLDSLADTVDVKLPAPQGAGIVGGEQVIVRFDGDPLFTGWIDTVAVSAGSGEARMSIKARSKTADIVDSSVDLDFAPSELFDVTLAGVCDRYVFLALKIAFRNLAGDLPSIAKVAVQVGESTFEVIERYARQSGVLLRTDAQGRLVLTRIGKTYAPAALVLGQNLLEFEATADLTNRFHFNKVVGQSSVGDDFAEDPGVNAVGESLDLEMRRTRILVTQAAGPATSEECQSQAEWQASVALARSRQVTAKVNGWGARGALWRPNQLVDFEAERFGLAAQLLIRGTTLTATGQEGLKASIELVDPESYLPAKEREEADTGLAAKLRETGWGET